MSEKLIFIILNGVINIAQYIIPHTSPISIPPYPYPHHMDTFNATLNHQQSALRYTDCLLTVEQARPTQSGGPVKTSRLINIKSDTEPIVSSISLSEIKSSGLINIKSAKKTLSAADKEIIMDHVRNGDHSWSAIGRKLGVSRNVVKYYFYSQRNKNNIEGHNSKYGSALSTQLGLTAEQKKIIMKFEKQGDNRWTRLSKKMNVPLFYITSYIRCVRNKQRQLKNTGRIDKPCQIRGGVIKPQRVSVSRFYPNDFFCSLCKIAEREYYDLKADCVADNSTADSDSIYNEFDKVLMEFD